MKLLYIGLLLSLLGYSPEKSHSQTFMGMEVDHVCLVIYQPSMFSMPFMPPPPPLPPNHPDSLEHANKLKEHAEKLKEHQSKTKDLSSSAITWKGRFNSKIIWKSKQCLDSMDMMELDSILSKKKTNETYPPRPLDSSGLEPPPMPPAMCYSPHHSVFLYKDDSVISYYDICFDCRRIKKEGSESLSGVEFRFLSKLYHHLGIPTNGKELKTYIAENKRTE